MSTIKKTWLKMSDTLRIFLLCFAFYLICKTLK